MGKFSEKLAWHISKTLSVFITACNNSTYFQKALRKLLKKEIAIIKLRQAVTDKLLAQALMEI